MPEVRNGPSRENAGGGENPSTLFHIPPVPHGASPYLLPVFDSYEKLSNLRRVVIALLISMTVLSGITYGETPTIIQTVSTPNTSNANGLGAGQNIKLELPRPSKAGNLLGIAWAVLTSSGISTISDDQGNTWANAISCSDSAFDIHLSIAPNAAANTRVITITTPFAAGFIQATAWEATNIATSSVVDATASNCPGTPLTTVHTGPMTTTQSGDLLIQYFSNTEGHVGGTTTATAPGNGWTLFSNNEVDGFGAQFQVQSAAGSITPTMTQGTPQGSQLTNTVAVALKSAAAGTPGDPGIQIVGKHYVAIQGGSPVTYLVTVPIRGNCMIDLFDTGSSTTTLNTITGVTSSPDISNNCALGSQHLGPGSTTAVQQFRCENVAPGNYTFTFTQSSTNGGDAGHSIYDISRAASSCFDEEVFNSGFKSGTGNLNSVTITPTTANGLIVANLAVDFNTVNATTTSGALLQDGFRSVNTGNTLYYNNNGEQSYLNPDTNPVTFGWGFMPGLGPDVGGWTSLAVAVKAAGASNVLLPPTNLTLIVR